MCYNTSMIPYTQSSRKEQPIEFFNRVFTELFNGTVYWICITGMGSYINQKEEGFMGQTYNICLDIGGTKILGAIFDADKKIVYRLKKKTKKDGDSSENIEKLSSVW